MTKGLHEAQDPPNPIRPHLKVLVNDGIGLPHKPVIYHWHECLELLLLEQGSCRLDLEQQVLPLQAGDLILIGACTSHGIADMAGCRFRVLQFAAEWLYDLAGFGTAELLPVLQPDHPCLALVRDANQPDLRRLLDEIEADLRDEPPALALSVRASLMKLMVWLIRRHQLLYPANPLELRWLEQLQPALQYMQRHFSEPVNERSVAALCYLSPHHFSRVFRQITGRSFISHLHALRLQEARRLLATTARPVQDIARAIGYAGPSHFTALFHRATGLTPLAYRKQICDRKQP
jgi:AraC-like DNA-binding protein